MPVLHLIAGPNGAGKTTFFKRVVEPATHLPFVNADEIAKARWPGNEERHGHAAARLAAAERDAAMAERRSFATETVFSHPSKLELIRNAKERGYLVHLHVILVPVELSVVRVALRARGGGHTVPEDKIRARYRRLWALVRQGVAVAHEAVVYDNSSARVPFREVAHYSNGRPLYEPDWPSWSMLG